MTESPSDPRRVDLTPSIDATRQIAERSRTRGMWSLAHLRLCWTALLAAGAVLGVIGGLTAGSRALAGVALGTAIVGLFFTVSAVVLARVGSRNPQAVMMGALTTYVAKVIALGVVLVLMPVDGPVDTRWLAGAVALGVFTWLAAHLRYVWTLKIFYVDPQ
ncbi:hypothetical protein FDO65_05390 [Nakamurella flava]|uniref:Uncharacterized protein n=1 Tax=Nakamurella flava TaxID=2576308 RepID=A0A4U6QL61_9ACTN|nr:hypothetical protein [Nakamurella flava]TKV61081.1 hypothetical protein FDO65_05390 [Nakamurella flava]